MLPARSKRKRNSTSTDSERKQYFFWLFRKGAYAHAEKKQHFSNGCRKEIVLLSVSERKQYFSWQFGQGACTHSEKKQYFFNGRGKEIVHNCEYYLNLVWNRLHVERKQYFRGKEIVHRQRHSYSVLIFSEPWSRKGSRWFVKDIEDHLFRFNAIYYRYNPIIDNVRCFFPQSSHDYTFSSYRRYAREVSGACPKGPCGGGWSFHPK